MQNSSDAVSEEDFRKLWQESLGQVKQEDIDILAQVVPEQIFTDDASSEIHELKEWIKIMLANFRMITLRRGKEKVLEPLTIYTPAMIRLVLIKSADEDGNAVGEGLGDEKAATHLSRQCEFAELCDALLEAGYEKEIKPLETVFDHALSIREDAENPQINITDSSKAITALITLARKISQNQKLTVADFLKKGFRNRATRNYLGFVHPELKFKDKPLERVWSAELLVSGSLKTKDVDQRINTAA